MKIIQLKSANIKRLKAVEIVLNEKQELIVISGKNAAGKSSVLDSIFYALGGAKIVPGKPIRDGEDHAEITLDLGDYVVTRTFTEKASYLKVENKEGAKYSNPQQLLDKLIGSLSFDPLEFTRLEAKKQIGELIKITGLDFSELDQKIKRVAEDRMFLTRELKTMGEVTDEEAHAAAPLAEKREVSITELSNQVNDAIINNEKRQTLLAAEIDLAKQIEDLKIKHSKVKIELENTSERVEIEPLQQQLSQAEQTNKSITKAREVMQKLTLRNEKKVQYDAFGNHIVALTEEKKKLLSAAKMPIEGLAWTEEAVTYHGIPFDQLSAAEQLKVSMAMAMTANPKIRVILIRDGSLLDSDNLKVIQEMAKDLNFQVFVEAVDESGKVGIFIEEGEVKTNNYDSDNRNT